MKVFTLISLLITIVLSFPNYTWAQVTNINIVKDFGAVPDDNINDSKAFIAASEFIKTRKGNVRLFIPKGKYLIGVQEVVKNKNYYYEGKNILDISNCNNVEIIGENGAQLNFDVGFLFGSFDPISGNSTSITWECKSKVKNVSSQRASLGAAISISNSQNVSIKNLILDGNFYAEYLNNMNIFNIRCVSNKSVHYQKDKINLGGGYGDCGIQIIHSGIRILNSGNVTVQSSTIRRFGTDGIYLSNDNNKKEHENISILNCTLDYNARTGIALTGGSNITIKNNTIQNTGKCVFFSTGTGIDIEAQGKSDQGSIKVQNLEIQENTFLNNTSGEILSKFGNGSENVRITKNKFHDVTRALNMNTGKNKNYLVERNIFNGKKVVLINGKNIFNDKMVESINFNKNSRE